ncbi:MAG: DnaD domain protein [Clostridiales bacterium]|nr:DnaD domain protein [Clostridiales bacterium]
MIQLQQDYEHMATSVPNLFIDEYMAGANGEFVKVYLYLLRCISGGSTGCSVCSIADHCGHTENDVLRALRYWERCGLIKITYASDEKISGITLCEPSRPEPTEHVISISAPSSGADDSSDEIPRTAADGSTAVPEEGATGVHNNNITAFRIKQPSPAKKYTPDEVDEFRRDPNVSELFYVIEIYLKRTLSSTDINTVLYWYDELHFAPDLICYLVEYCISKGHSNLRYMDKVAAGWNDAGISTVEQAKENAAMHSKAYYAVMKAFGITGRSLTEDENAYVTRWTKEYGFDLSIVLEACRRTIAATHQPSFEYTEAILKDWLSNNVHTNEDILTLDKAYAKAKKSSLPPKEASRRSNKFSNFNQRDYNYEQLEQYLLNTTIQ